jgi:uracil-DNA glycosylase family 4
LSETRAKHPDWHNAPVPAFGDPNARLLVIGLAPGLGGANRHGRPFTGDESGNWLWDALHREGFASLPEGRHREDGLVLKGAIVTNAVKCAPPENKPTALEIATCRTWLVRDVASFPEVRVVVALGKVAHDAWLSHLGVKRAQYAFAHGAIHEIEGAPLLIDSFHPSPLNTRTGRMSRRSWNALWKKAARLARESWWVYVAKCGDGTLYTGITNDLEKRRAKHESGKGAKYTRGRGSIELIYTEKAPSKGAALRREHAIKQLDRAQKLRLTTTAAP